MDKILELEKRIKDLENWKKKKELQQISIPLDQNSIDILHSKLLVFDTKSSSTITANKSIKVIIDGQPYKINVL